MSTLPRLEAEVLSRNIIFDPPMTDEELERFCRRNGDVQIERTSEGVVQLNAPAGGLTGHGNSEIIRQLGNWWDTHQRGRIFDSSTGFFLPDGSLMCPDAAYAHPAQLHGLTKAELSRMPYLCPAFVIELLSATDSLSEAEVKMQRWIANGAQLGWLVDPYQQCVTVYEPGMATARIRSAAVHGSGPVDGFVLDVGKVWRCYQV